MGVTAKEFLEMGSREAKTINEDHSTGAMLCLRPSDRMVKKITGIKEYTEPEDEVHITLAYLGTVGEDAGDEWDRERLYRGCYDFALHGGFGEGLKGKVNGFGIFMNPDANVLVALWDLPGSNDLRTRLMDKVASHGYVAREDDHGFTPHSTISYSDSPFKSIPSLPSGDLSDTFGSIWLVWGEEWNEIPLR